jgi:hypothetical protein
MLRVRHGNGPMPRQEEGSVKGGRRRRAAVFALACGLLVAPAVASHVLAGVTGFGVDDSYAVNEDRRLVVDAPGVLANDGPDGPPVLCVDLPNVDTTGLKGELEINANGRFAFRPDANFHGSTSFTYKMGTSYGSTCPEGGPSNDATVTITVRSANDPPTIRLDDVCVDDITVAEDSDAFDDPGRCVEMVDFGPIDENNQNFKAWLVSTNKPELFAAGPSIEPVDGRFGRLSFTPAPNANGRARVTVRGRDTGGKANGGANTSEPVRFDIVITPTNDPPGATADAYEATSGTTLEIAAPGVLGNDRDIDGDELTAQVVSDPGHGTLSMLAAGGFSYTPDVAYVGPDSFSYRASDGVEFSPTRVVSITVVAAPAPSPGAGLPTDEPSVAPTVAASPAPSFVPASADPSGGPSESTAPGGAPGPDASPTAGGGSILVLLAGVLLVAFLAFGAGLYLPKLVARGRAAPADREPPDSP